LKDRQEIKQMSSNLGGVWHALCLYCIIQWQLLYCTDCIRHSLYSFKDIICPLGERKTHPKLLSVLVSQYYRVTPQNRAMQLCCFALTCLLFTVELSSANDCRNVSHATLLIPALLSNFSTLREFESDLTAFPHDFALENIIEAIHESNNGFFLRFYAAFATGNYVGVQNCQTEPNATQCVRLGSPFLLWIANVCTDDFVRSASVPFLRAISAIACCGVLAWPVTALHQIHFSRISVGSFWAPYLGHTCRGLIDSLQCKLVLVVCFMFRIRVFFIFQFHL